MVLQPACSFSYKDKKRSGARSERFLKNEKVYQKMEDVSFGFFAPKDAVRTPERISHLFCLRLHSSPFLDKRVTF